MNSSVTVSIVIPVYNVEKYLRECIESVINQSYRNLQIILVDDGSTDSSGNICDEYAEKDSRITVIHKTNGGLSDARNSGLAIAEGKYVYFLDSDDYIEKQAIEILVGISEQNQLDALFFNANITVEEGCEYPATPHKYVAKGSYPEPITGPEFFLQLKRSRDYQTPVQLYFFRHDFLTDNNLTFKKGIIHEDNLFTFIMLLNAKHIMHIPAALYNRRYRPGSIMTSSRSQKNSDGMYAALDEALHKYRYFLDNPDTREAYTLGIRHLASGYFHHYKQTEELQDSKGREQFKIMMKELKEFCYDIEPKKPSLILRVLRKIKSLIGKIPGLKKLYNTLKDYFSPNIDDECKDITARLKETNNPSFKRIILLYAPRYANRGDIAIALAERKLIQERCKDYVLIEVPHDLCRNYPNLVTRHLNGRDIILITGGGFFGSLWRYNLLAILYLLRNFRDNRVIVMPQTVFYYDTDQGRQELESDKEEFSKFNDLHVFVRDRTSYDIIRKNNLFPNAKTVSHVPDMVCSMDFGQLNHGKRSGVLVCLRPDIENVLTCEEQNTIYAGLLRKYGKLNFYITNPANSPAKIHEWESKLTESLETLSQAELLITDRLHGMLFAAITGTPCVAFNNLSGKVHSVYEWISYCDYIQLCSSIDDLNDAIGRALGARNEWDNSRLLPYFDEIVKLILTKE